MASFNKVILMGNLTRDPELRFTSGGTPVCNVRLAVNRRIQDQSGDWRDEPVFVDVTVWGKRGEAFAKFHSKGRAAFIEGHLRMDEWDDKQTGNKRTKIYVVADNWEFVGGGRDGGDGGGGGGSYEPEPAGREELSDTPF